MKISGKFILKVAGTLTVISLVVALLLGCVNGVTEDPIAAIEADRVQTQLILAQSERPRSVEDLAEVSETVPDTVSRLAAQV